jgi:PKD repeat protein
MNKRSNSTRILILTVTIWFVCGLFFSGIVQAQGGATVSIGAPTQVAAGTDFIAMVNIGNVTNFDATNYDVTFNPAVLQVSNVTSGLISGTTIPVDMWSVITPGTLRVIQNVPGLSGVSGSGYLSRIGFHVIGSAGSNSQINFANGVLSNTSANQIQATWVNGSVQISTVLDANFSASPREGISNLTLFTFVDATTGGTPPYTYRWDFNNDGLNESTLQSPTYVYTSAGTYTVVQTVTDSSLAGTVNTETKIGYIVIYAPLTAAFSASPTEGVNGRTVFTFTDQSTGGKGPYSYQWQFGDSNTSTLQNPTHVYASAGTYTITLTVTEGLLTSNTLTKTAYISVYKAGDANKDGTVNSLDITKVERIIMTLDATAPGADSNGDGNVNALDITRIEQLIMGG